MSASRIGKSNLLNKFLKILQTIASCSADAGGPSRSVSALAAAIAAPDCKVELITLDTGIPKSQLVLPSGHFVNTHLCPCRTSFQKRFHWSPDFSKTLNHLSHSSKPVLIHDNGVWLPTNHSATAVARRNSIPLIISPRGMLTQWSWNFRRFKKRVAWCLYQRRDLLSAQVLHATSKAEADDLRMLGFKQPIAIIPNGVRLPDDINKLEIKNWKSGVKIALFLSRIHPKKGLLDLVVAWDKIRPQGWKVVVGGGDELKHRAEVERGIQRCGLSEQFQFIGAVPDTQKWEVYHAADLFVLPTKSENFGIVIAEALASGLPVITTRATPWEELETHHCGWWIEAGWEPLVKALQEAVGLNDTERKEMGVRGRKLVENRYSWQVVAGKMRSVYEWIAGKGSKPSCIV